jgi:hypothetical protein
MPQRSKDCLNSLAIAPQHAARYIVCMNTRSLSSAIPLPARPIAILSLGLLPLLLRAART